MPWTTPPCTWPASSSGLSVDAEIVDHRRSRRSWSRRSPDRSRPRRYGCRSDRSAARLHEVAAASSIVGRRAGSAASSAKRDGAIGADDADRAVGDLEVAARRFERVGRERLELVGELVAARSTEAPPTGIELEPPVPPPVATQVGVALDHARSCPAAGRDARRRAAHRRFAWPCPVDCVPISTVTVPSSSSAPSPVSGPLMPQASI